MAAIAPTRVFKGTARAQVAPLLAVVAGAVLLIVRGGLAAGHTINVFGFVVVLFLVLALTFGAANALRPATLTLDARGFSWRSWRYGAFYPWSDLERFFVAPARAPGSPPKIAFNFLPGRIPSQLKATNLNRRTNGYDRSMANVWDISSDELVALLNEYLARSRDSSAP